MRFFCIAEFPYTALMPIAGFTRIFNARPTAPTCSLHFFGRGKRRWRGGRTDTRVTDSARRQKLDTKLTESRSQRTADRLGANLNARSPISSLRVQSTASPFRHEVKRLALISALIIALPGGEISLGPKSNGNCATLRAGLSFKKPLSGQCPVVGNGATNDASLFVQANQPWRESALRVECRRWRASALEAAA